jgi:Ran GTPase-activating protein (RanGAP) involved in mRNA processing and transport
MNVGPDGAASLAWAIAESIGLTSVDLSLNEIGDVGAASLAKAIAKSKTIVSINLSSNEIGDDGFRALANAVLSSRRNVCVEGLPTEWHDYIHRSRELRANVSEMLRRHIPVDVLRPLVEGYVVADE